MFKKCAIIMGCLALSACGKKKSDDNKIPDGFYQAVSCTSSGTETCILQQQQIIQQNTIENFVAICSFSPVNWLKVEGTLNSDEVGFAAHYDRKDDTLSLEMLTELYGSITITYVRLAAKDVIQKANAAGCRFNLSEF